ncbi:putative dehydrogenase [Elusimicrobium simillimum]|uniref:Gfo/Idh/MocA family protein n=1 Tax=Elusimicrobium simillimum TaxID=3143438 RepID=UPI003C7006FD
MKEIKVAVLGCGFMGKAHIYGYQTIPLYYDPDFKIKLVGVYNRTLAKAQHFKDLYNFEFATDNEDDIFSRADIDVINICTPNTLHKQEIIKALNSKKHVYCEKPAVSSYADMQEVLGHPNLEKVTTQTVFHNRFYPAVKRAKELIENGVLGQVLSFRGNMLHDSNSLSAKAASWRNSGGGNGGVVYDLGSHICDMIYYLLGDFDSVVTKNQIAYPTRPGSDGAPVKIDAEDASYSLVKLKNGAYGTIEVTKIATGKPGNPKLEIHGEKGAIIIDLINPNFVQCYDNTAPKGPHGGMAGFTQIQTIQHYEEDGSTFPPGNHTLGFLRAHADCLYSFLSCVSRGKQASPSLKDSLYVQSVLEAMYKSARSGAEERV